MAHHHSHAHHAHAHHHHDDTQNPNLAFNVAIVLNAIFVAVEFGFGVIADSTALMADAGHNLSDVLGLLLALGASILARRTPGGRYTYGLRSTSILAALANGMLLMATCGGIAWEAVQRFAQTPQVAGHIVMMVASVGILVNGVSAWLFVRGSKSDLNVRGAYLHMLADAAVSLGVAVAGVAMMYTGWYWLDPMVSLLVVAIIMLGTWGLLRESLRLALSAVPPHIDVAAVEDYLRQCRGVSDIHDLHIWGMSTTESALTVHLVMPDGYPGDDYMDEIMCVLRDRYAIHHSTLQVEQGTTHHACTLHAHTGHTY